MGIQGVSYIDAILFGPTLGLIPAQMGKSDLAVNLDPKIYTVREGHT